MSILKDFLNPQKTDDSNVLIFGESSSDDLSSASAQYNNGYLANPYVRRACDIWGVRVASIDTILYDEQGEELEGSRLGELLDHPNPLMSGVELKKRIGTSLGMHGEAILYPEKTPTGWTLWFLDSQLMTCEPSMDLATPVKTWRCSRFINGRNAFDPSELIHIRLPDPDQTKPRGLSPMVSCAKSVLMQNAIREWNISTTRNGSSPSVALEIPSQITRENREALQRELAEKYSGKANAKKGIVLDNGKKLSILGMTAVEMDYLNGWTQAGKEIAIAYGIPPEKLGDSATKTYSNSVEASREEITNTIKPLLDIIYGALWQFFKDKVIATGVSDLTYDIEQLTDCMGAQTELYTALQSVTFLTPNEKRKKLGYEPIDNPIADDLMMSMADQPMGDFDSGVPLDNDDDLMRLLG